MFIPPPRVALIIDCRVLAQNLVDLEKGPLRKFIISPVSVAGSDC